MIELLQKERRNGTTWCIACVNQCGTQDEMVCDTCLGYLATYHKCPRCNMVDHFYGNDQPDYCKCGFTWPELCGLKDDVDERVAYHLKEE